MQAETTVVTCLNPTLESDSGRRTRCFFRWTLRHLADGASSHSSIMVTLDPPVTNLHFQRLDISLTDCMLGADTKLSLRLRLPWRPRVTPEAAWKCEAEGCGTKGGGGGRAVRQREGGVGGGASMWNWWEVWRNGEVTCRCDWRGRLMLVAGRGWRGGWWRWWCGGQPEDEFLIFVSLSDYQWGRLS